MVTWQTGKVGKWENSENSRNYPDGDSDGDEEEDGAGDEDAAGAKPAASKAKGKGPKGRKTKK